jgi:hypothetical protein
MFAPNPQDVEGIFALAFFFGLIIFVCFEAVQVARGRIHLAGIGRAGLEILILSPAIVLIPVLALIWAPWTHYRALHITRARKRVHKVT